MSDVCEGCGCAHCECVDVDTVESLRARVAELERQLTKAVAHATDEESQKWAAIKERDEASAEVWGTRKARDLLASDLSVERTLRCMAEGQLDAVRSARDSLSDELANKSKPVKYARDTTLRDAITDTPNPEK